MRRLIAIVLLVAACGDDDSVSTTTVPAATTLTTTTTASGPHWTRLANLPAARSELPAAVLDGKIYVSGGYMSTVTGVDTVSVVEFYDPATDEWTRITDMPAGRNHAMSAAADGHLFVFGGNDSAGEYTDTTFRYDPATDTWDQRALMPAAASAGGAVTLDGFIYVVGGAPNGLSVFRYDPVADEWVELAPLSRPRDHLAVAVWDGLIIALGGRWDGEEFATIEIYDPATNTWTEGPTMLEGRSGFGAAVLEGRLVTMGGELVSQPETLDTTESLGSLDGSWESIESLPVALHGHAVVELNGVLYVLGGSRRAGDVANPGDTLALIP
jgi:hypothetical protein